LDVLGHLILAGSGKRVVITAISLLSTELERSFRSGYLETLCQKISSRFLSDFLLGYLYFSYWFVRVLCRFW
jgi:hypothetical protein